jgi:hypothetical protein
MIMLFSILLLSTIVFHFDIHSLIRRFGCRFPHHADAITSILFASLRISQPPLRHVMLSFSSPRLRFLFSSLRFHRCRCFLSRLSPGFFERADRQDIADAAFSQLSAAFSFMPDISTSAFRLRDAGWPPRRHFLPGRRHS